MRQSKMNQMRYRNLEIIGTSHIAIESADLVQERIETVSPEIVAIELDKSRLDALFHEEKQKISLSDIFHIGLTGFIFMLIARWAEEKLGSVVNAKPGDEMRRAVRVASKVGAKIALVDQDIGITLKRISGSITWKEKFRFVKDIIKALILPKQELKEFGIKTLDLRKVPEERIVKKLTLRLKKDYPNVYASLIEERNDHMAMNLVKLMKSTDNKLIAVVGAGHVEGIMEHVKKNINKFDFIKS